MPRVQQIINPKEAKRLAKLRVNGPREIDNCIKEKIKNLPELDQVAILSETGRLDMFYEAIGKAGVLGHSWLEIANAANGATESQQGRQLTINYLSYCRNNGIEPVKIRSSKSK